MTVEELGEMRQRMEEMGVDHSAISDGDLRAYIQQRILDFQDKAPTTAESAARTILEGIQAGRWRILVGEDAHLLDSMVRERPEEQYESDFLQELFAKGHLTELVPDA